MGIEVHDKNTLSKGTKILLIQMITKYAEGSPAKSRSTHHLLWNSQNI